MNVNQMFHIDISWAANEQQIRI